MKDLKKLLSHRKIGLIMRTYAVSEADVNRQVDMVIQAIKKALSISLFGKEVYSRIDILIPMDSRFPKNMDCGKTMEALIEKINSDPSMSGKIYVTEIYRGDLFCGVLNAGIAKQVSHGVFYSVILSPPAHSYMNVETMIDILQQAANGAWVVGVAIDELRESVLKGRLANTFCLWQNDRLIEVGGFNLHAAMPIDEASASFKRGYDTINNKDVYYMINGVEEIIPLCYMYHMNNEESCAAAVLPRGEDQEYTVPPEGDERNRHFAKMFTKEPRQRALAFEAGFDLSYLEGSLTPMLEEVA